jgi:hypothetical protein
MDRHPRDVYIALGLAVFVTLMLLLASGVLD